MFSLNFGGGSRQERDEVTLVLLKAGMLTCVFCFSDSEGTGKNKRKKKKKINRKSFSHIQERSSLKPTSLREKIVRQVEFRCPSLHCGTRLRHQG